MKKIIQLLVACLLVSTALAADPSSVPVFQMRLVLDAPSADSESMCIVDKNKDTTHKEVLNVQKTVLLDQAALKSVEVHDNALGQPGISITLTDSGRKRFAEVTRQNIGKRLAMVIDGQLYCAPVIQMEIAGGQAEINGSFTEKEAKDLAKKIAEKLKQ